MPARLRAWFRSVPIASAHAGTDGELVRRFVAARDEAAFSELVRRHGPMVLATCRRVLHPDAHTAEDAFQATFLVLATKAAAVSPPDRVGAWLHGVAVHVARKAQGRARKLAPATGLDHIPAPDVPPPDGGELRATIDDALAGMPAKYRAAVVLCDLEERSRAEAARTLGWSEGTLSGRLARARKLLADRLARRGVALPATGLAGAIAATNAVANVPPALTAATLHTAALVAAGTSAGEMVPDRVAALAQSVAIRPAKTKLLAAGLAAAGVAFGLGLYAIAAERPAPPPGRLSAPIVSSEVRFAPAPPAVQARWAVKHEFGCPAAVASVALGAKVVAVGDEKGRLFVWDSTTGARKGASNLSTWKFEPLLRVQVLPDGTVRAVTGSSEDRAALYYLDFRPPFNRDAMGVMNSQTPFGGTADGTLSLVYENDQRDITLWDNDPDAGKKGGATRRARFRHEHIVLHAAGDTGTAVATVTNVPELRLWSAAAHEPVWTVRLNEKRVEIDVTSVCVAPGGRFVAVTGTAGQVWVYDSTSGKPVSRTTKFAGKVWAAAFAPDGKSIVAGCDDGTARVTDALTGEEMFALSGHTAAVRSVAFSPDGKLIATGSADKNAKVWQFQK